LLGGFHASVDGSPASGFDTDKTRALLVYIAMEASRAHSREALAGLLWPELAEEAARRNLRVSLFKLRQVLGEEGTSPGFLLVTPQTVQIDPAAGPTDTAPLSRYRLDVALFSELIAACRTHRHRRMEYCSTCRARLRQAADLYRGDFLEGFFLWASTDLVDRRKTLVHNMDESHN